MDTRSKAANMQAKEQTHKPTKVTTHAKQQKPEPTTENSNA
jgi:hypothetical protein